MPSDQNAIATAPALPGTTPDQTYRETVGHELRSPLTVIRTALDTVTDDLAQTSISPEMVHMLEIALRNTRRLEEAVDRHLQELEQAHVRAAAAESNLPD
ncbi:MAG: hypothetical protein GY838_11875 [bacterium]|nr:hypothetical protein [bacterium]